MIVLFLIWYKQWVCVTNSIAFNMTKIVDMYASINFKPVLILEMYCLH